jgi:hypothetical protein
MFERRYTKDSYYLYLETYDENDELLTKLNYKDIQDTMHDYRVCAPLGGLGNEINRYLKQFTEFDDIKRKFDI